MAIEVSTERMKIFDQFRPLLQAAIWAGLLIKLNLKKLVLVEKMELSLYFPVVLL